jgi:hypothetical protein
MENNITGGSVALEDLEPIRAQARESRPPLKTSSCFGYGTFPLPRRTFVMDA